MHLVSQILVLIAAAATGYCQTGRVRLSRGARDGLLLGLVIATGLLLIPPTQGHGADGPLVAGFALLGIEWCLRQKRGVAETSAAFTLAALTLLFAAIGAEAFTNQPTFGATVRTTLATAGLVILWRGAGWTLAGYGLLGATPWLARAWFPSGREVVSRSGWPLFLLALVILAAVVGEELLRWNRQRLHWERTGGVLPREWVGLHGALLVGIGSLIVLIGIAQTHLALAPLTLGVIALAVMSWAHMRDQGLAANTLRKAGLALAVMAAGVMGPAWVSTAPAGWQLGLVIAGAWAIWLARFWRQQLQGGQAWTAAGGLILTAAELALTATAALAAQQIASLQNAAMVWSPTWLIVIGAIGITYLAVAQLAEARDSQNSAFVMAFALAVLSFTANLVSYASVVSISIVAPLSVIFFILVFIIAGSKLVARNILLPITQPFRHAVLATVLSAFALWIAMLPGSRWWGGLIVLGGLIWLLVTSTRSHAAARATKLSGSSS